jgi:hypothetical protein
MNLSDDYPRNSRTRSLSSAAACSSCSAKRCGAAIDEELCSGHCRGEPLRDLVVLVGLENVQLQAYAVRPRRRPGVALLAERHGGIAEDRAIRARPCLSERLSCQHAGGETDIEKVAWQRLNLGASALDRRHRPSERLGVRRPIFVRLERPAVVKVGRMHGVASGAQLTGETADGTGEPERVVQDDDLGHRQSISTSPRAPSPRVGSRVLPLLRGDWPDGPKGIELVRH